MNDLRLRRDIISLEADAGVGALRAALGRIPAFLEGVVTSFSETLVKPFKRESGLVGSLSGFSREVQHRNYADMRGGEAIVPQGLTIDLLSYGKHLEEAADAVVESIPHVLQPLSAWLGTKLSTPASLASVTDSLQTHGFKPHDVKKLQHVLTQGFATHGVLASTVTYGQAIKRNADWAEIDKLVQRLNSKLGAQFHGQLLDLTREVETRIGLLIERVTNEPETYAMSPAAIKNLSTAAYQAATEVEFYGVLRFKVEEFYHALEETLKTKW